MCLWVYVHECRLPWKPEEGVRSPGDGVPCCRQGVASSRTLCSCPTRSMTLLQTKDLECPRVTLAHQRDTQNVARLTQRVRTGSRPASSLAGVSKQEQCGMTLGLGILVCWPDTGAGTATETQALRWRLIQRMPAL